MKNQMLLLEDVDGLGRSGDIVTVKPGFARNCLLPKKKAVIAGKHLIKLQERLRATRAKKAVEDKNAALALAKQLEGKVIKTQVKIDTSGHMYGSVTAVEIAHMCNEQLGTSFEKKNVGLTKPVKRLGVHEIELKLNEGITGKVSLEIEPEEGLVAPAEEVPVEETAEAPAETEE